MTVIVNGVKFVEYDMMCANMSVDVPAETSLSVANQYYDIAGTFADGTCDGFTLSNGVLTCLNGGKYLFNGISDITVDRACKITYALAINGVPQSDITTEHTFQIVDDDITNDIDGIGITRVLVLNPGDQLKVQAKSDTSNTDMTANTLSITFWGR